MEYQIVDADDLDELVEKVNKAIAEGWQPVGGVAVSHWPCDNHKFDNAFYWEYLQAMTRAKP